MPDSDCNASLRLPDAGQYGDRILGLALVVNESNAHLTAALFGAVVACAVASVDVGMSNPAPIMGLERGGHY